jgi:hypothetical protein
LGNTKWRTEPTDVEKSADELWLVGEMPIELGASWISPKCVEAQRYTTGYLGVKHCFGAGCESGTKS